MTPLLLGSPALSDADVSRIAYIVGGLVAFMVFLLVARVSSHLIGQQLVRRHVRADMVVLGRRVVTVAILAIGILAALSFATQTANLTLVGILLATVIAALGVQDLLRDYVSGYYILLERHMRVGDRIGFDDKVGTIGEVKLRVTLIRTDSGDVIIMPNSELFNKPVTVFSKRLEEVAKPSEPPA